MTPAYQRTTTAADLSDLAPAIATALREHADSVGLQITDELPAWQTRSLNPPSTSFVGKLLGRRANPADPDSEHQTLVVLHPTHLIIVVSGARRGTNALSVPTAVASVADGPRLPGADAGTGFSITGFPGDAGRPGSFFIGTGPPAGEACAAAVRAAIIAAKNP